MKKMTRVICGIALIALWGAVGVGRAADEAGASADQKSQLEQRLDNLQTQLDQAEAKDAVGEQFLEMARNELMLARKVLARGNERAAAALARQCEQSLAKATGSEESTDQGSDEDGDQPAEEVQP